MIESCYLEARIIDADNCTPAKSSPSQKAVNFPIATPEQGPNVFTAWSRKARISLLLLPLIIVHFLRELLRPLIKLAIAARTHRERRKLNYTRIKAPCGEPNSRVEGRTRRWEAGKIFSWISASPVRLPRFYFVALMIIHPRRLK